MKILKRLLLWFGILLILVFIAGSFYVKFYGKSLIEDALNASLKRNVVLGEASYHFPFGLQAQDVRIARSLEGGEFLKVKKITAQLSVNAIVRRELAFDTVVLIEPSIVIEDTKEPVSASQEQIRRYGIVIPSVGSESSTAKEDQNKDEQIRVSIQRLIVKQGRVAYVNGLTEKGFSFNLEDVQLKARQLVFPPVAGRLEFDISARLVKKDNPLSGSNVKGQGWVDVVNGDMEAKIEIVEANGTVGLTAEAVSKNNDMQVKGEIKMRNLLRQASKQASSDTSTINDLVFDALSSAGVEIGAQFSFKTKMDNFQLGQVSFSGNVVTKR